LHGKPESSASATWKRCLRLAAKRLASIVSLKEWHCRGRCQAQDSSVDGRPIMKQIIPFAVVAMLLGARASVGQEPAKPSDTPVEVLEVLERATGSWYAKVGSASCACTVNSRANGRCVLVEGRRFADAMSFTSLFGWYAPSRQLIGLVVFENGESLLVRASIQSLEDGFALEGSAVGIAGGKPIKATYEATCGENVWSIEAVAADGETIEGRVRSTDSR
jgi:hypothetical protein